MTNNLMISLSGQIKKIVTVKLKLTDSSSFVFYSFIIQAD